MDSDGPWPADQVARGFRDWNGLAAAIARVKLALVPAGETIGPIIAKIALACRRDSATDATDAKAARASMAAIFVQHIGPYPADVVAAAADEWIAGNVFFPAVAELRAICERIAAPRKRALVRLEALEKQRAEAERLAKLDRPTPEQMEEIKRKLAAKWATRRAPEQSSVAETPRHELRKRLYVDLPDDQRAELLDKVAPKA